MEVFIAEQTKAFIFIAMLGVALGLFYDVLRFIRLLLKDNKVVTWILDLLFCIVCTAVFFAFTLSFMQGQVRGYGIIGCALGATLYFLGVSPFVMAVLKPLVGALLGFPQKICKIFRKIVGLTPKR